MTKIDNDQLVTVNGGVIDRGDGQGCIPDPFPRPRPPVIDPIDGNGIPGSTGSWRPSWPNVVK